MKDEQNLHIHSTCAYQKEQLKAMLQIIPMQVLSTDGQHQLEGVVYLPQGTPKGIFQIVHGMTEYIGRYHDFMCQMADTGYICFGYDHLGHGKTAAEDGVYGYIAPKGGWKLLCKDVNRFAEAVRTQYGKELPYYLMGHSMGSFIVRIAVAKGFSKPDKLIVMGTGGPNPAAIPGLALLSLIRAFRGDKHISPFAEKIMFGSYNKRFPEGDLYAWLTKDQGVRDRYRQDEWCTFHFTISALLDLIRLTKNANGVAGQKNVPTLLVSGKMDPVGNYGKGVVQAQSYMEKSGIPVTLKLYENARHEILNDDCKETVTKDILAFIENV